MSALQVLAIGPDGRVEKTREHDNILDAQKTARDWIVRAHCRVVVIRQGYGKVIKTYGNRGALLARWIGR